MQEKLLGSEHPDVATSLNDLGSMYVDQGSYSQAEQLHRRALEIREKVFGPGHPEVAESLALLGSLRLIQGSLSSAEPLFRRALEIREKSFGPEHQEVAAYLHGLAALYQLEGHFGQAEALYRRALAIREKALGPEDPAVAQTLNALAALYQVQGRELQAEPLLRRALAIREKVLGPDDPDVVASLVSLAAFYGVKGQEQEVEGLYRRALAIREKALGPDHLLTAEALGDLARFLAGQGQYGEAELLFRRALGITEKAFGPEYAGGLTNLLSLAALYGARKEYAEAERLARRALVIAEKAVGSDHPFVAINLIGLAMLQAAQEQYAEAEVLYRRALAVSERAVGAEHRAVTGIWAALGGLRWAQGDLTDAVHLLAQAADVEEHLLGRTIGSGSERAKSAYLAARAPLVSMAVSLHVTGAPQDTVAQQLALSAVLRWKGRSLDVMADFLVAARRRVPEAQQPVFGEWVAARNRYAMAALRPQRDLASGPRSDLRTLAARIEDLEVELGSSIAALGLRPDEITLDRVRQAIPPGAALVEIVAFQPRDPRAAARPEAPRRYTAYVVFRDEPLAWVDLGEAATIDAEVAAFRVALRDPGRADVVSLARALDERLMRPIRTLLRDRQLVLLSPDGALNLLPFGALIDERQRPLADQFTFVYLTSGRDLLRLQLRAPSREGVLIVAAPDFDGTTGLVEARPPPGQVASSSRRSADFAKRGFLPLLATTDEARAIRAFFPDATVLTGSTATEAVLRGVHGPRVLHLATHGFFLPDQPSTGAWRRDLEDLTLFPPDNDPAPENPLLRSGLALAGANRLQNGDDDGLLTALEVTSMDLVGTKLVVLSACETGVGTTPYGDGVYGLRRALVLAGAESQVMSLWPVDDDTTRDLMVAYYGQLARGEGRAEALRLAQREIAASPGRGHPFFWAGFIPIGAWGPLE
jgi:CHAT domain-containing protein/tetratricopeptide (TPR) repeat protein